MEVQHKEISNKGLFFIRDNGKRIGEMVYTRVNEHLIDIEHTEVAAEYIGKGLAQMLLAKAVEYARENQQKIIPTCAFAKSAFDRKPEIGDVLFKGT